MFVEGNALQTEIRRISASEDIEVPLTSASMSEPLEDPPAEIAPKGFHIIYNTGEAAKTEAKIKTDCAPDRLARRAEQPSYETTKAASISAAWPKYR